jgi:signal transduction histidine kinase
VEEPYQHLALRPDGSRFPVEVSARSLPYRGRSVRVTALRDVSARVKAEELQRRLETDLRHAAEEWRQTFDALDLGIVLADSEARLIRLNRAALAEAAQSSFGEAAGQKLGRLARVEPWRTLLDLHGRVGASGVSHVAQAFEPTSERSFYLLGSPWFRGAGEPPWRVLTFRDVTEFMKLQEQLRQSRVLEAMGSLVAGVAHEVRNPLFSISATVDAVEAIYGVQPELKQHVALLRSQVGRLTQLTRDLLDYGRPQALQRTSVDLGEVVRRACRACATLLENRRVSVEERLASGLPRLHVDAARVEQALENLLANAIQHSPEGGVVTVRGGLETSAGERFVCCAVEDHGRGLDPEDFARVFEPFFTRRKGGTGLGLAIVRRIVSAHGGRAYATNRREGGACFTLWLPVHAPRAADAR